MNQSVFPSVDSTTFLPSDGYLYTLSSYCSNGSRAKCKSFYSDIIKSDGFYQCPYGFSSYVFHEKDYQFCWTCLRLSGFYNPSKVKNKITATLSPKINKKFIVKAATHYLSINNYIRKMSDNSIELNNKVRYLMEKDVQKDYYLKSTFHEFRRLNTQIKRQAEESLSEANNKALPDMSFINFRLGNIFATSSLISVRLNSYDAAINPDLIFSENRTKTSIYSKFEKIKNCLHTIAASSNNAITFSGQSYGVINAFHIFEMLPYLVLENAVKFSPPEQDISVNFEEDINSIIITIRSYGPIVLKKERNKIFEKDYRGIHARKKIEGTGAGLFLAKLICDHHDANISVLPPSGKSFTLDGIQYYEFILQISIHKRLVHTSEFFAHDAI